MGIRGNGGKEIRDQIISVRKVWEIDHPLNSVWKFNVKVVSKENYTGQS